MHFFCVVTQCPPPHLLVSTFASNISLSLFPNRLLSVSISGIFKKSDEHSFITYWMVGESNISNTIFKVILANALDLKIRHFSKIQ
jgi:hypothetical protein